MGKPQVFDDQEQERVFDPARPPQFFFVKAERRVTCYYFYVFDERWGPGFIKVCAYFPHPVKVWVNGREWAKRQLTRAEAGFAELSNGFAACDDPAGLQAICDRLGPAEIQAFFDRWLSRLPVPLTAADQAAGCWWELSMRQLDVIIGGWLRALAAAERLARLLEAIAFTASGCAAWGTGRSSCSPRCCTRKGDDRPAPHSRRGERDHAGQAAAGPGRPDGHGGDSRRRPRPSATPRDTSPASPGPAIS